MSFIFGKKQRAKTPEEAARLRAVAEAMQTRGLGPAPQNIGEGLTAVGRAIAARRAMSAADAAESQVRARQEAGEANINSQWDSLFGQQSAPTASLEASGGYAPEGVEAAPAATPARTNGSAGANPFPGIDPRLINLYGNPLLSEGKRAILKMRIEQLMEAADPNKALARQKTQLEIDQMRNPQMSPGDEARLAFDREKLAAEQSAPPKPTDDIAEYNFYVEQTRAAGQEPLPFDQFMVTQKKAGASSVNINRTEGERGGDVILESIQPDLAQINLSFSSLTDPSSQIGSAIEGIGGGAIGRWMQTEDYQVTEDAAANIIQGFMVTTSGATVPDPELKRRLKGVMPAVGDKPERIAAKKQRLLAYVEGIRRRAGPNSPVGDGLDPDSVQQAPAMQPETVPQKRLRYNPATGELE